MSSAVETCVHCGFCLPACPTYHVFGEEMDSPRGRVVLMKSVLEGSVQLDDAVPYLDRCLGCLGCVTACPSGVAYGDLIMPFRTYAEERRQRPVVNRLARRMLLETLPYPGRFRLAARLGKASRPVSRILPYPFRSMVSLLPDTLPDASPLPEVYPAQGKRRARVALLAGCVQQVLEPEINWSTLRVLARNGVEVVIPREQGCCGALSMHSGDEASARSFAARNLNAFPRDVEAIVTNAAGCGSSMAEYPLLFAGSAERDQVEAFSARVIDVSVFLGELGITPPPATSQNLTIAYQDACHLAHAQRVTEAPRRLLSTIDGLRLVPIPEADLCCGSAGTYNLEQPEAARQLGARKVANILSTGAQGVVSGNIGCIMQIRDHLRRLGQHLPVWHTMELLDLAYREGIEI